MMRRGEVNFYIVKFQACGNNIQGPIFLRPRQPPYSTMLNYRSARKRGFWIDESLKRFGNSVLCLNRLFPAGRCETDDREAALMINIHEEHTSSGIIPREAGGEFKGECRLPN